MLLHVHHYKPNVKFGTYPEFVS